MDETMTGLGMASVVVASIGVHRGGGARLGRIGVAGSGNRSENERENENGQGQKSDEHGASPSVPSFAAHFNAPPASDAA